MKTKPKPERRRKKPVNTTHPTTPSSTARLSFPIVGIGASAGGLEALEQFLVRVPAGSGMAQAPQSNEAAPQSMSSAAADDPPGARSRAPPQ